MKKLLLVLSLALTLVCDSVWAFAPAKAIDALGLGQHIAGLDISVYQHPGEAAIDFKKMYASGIRFVIIKGGDALDRYDAQAMKYFLPDRKAAQAAKLYTSFYYYATLPDSTDENIVIQDAQAQAQKIIWRIASLGGYGKRDMPVALDMENNCVRVNQYGSCAKYTSKNLISIWTQSWLDTVYNKTHRKPFLYSYANFLENNLVRSTALRQYPLWLAHYSLSPAVPTNQPNSKKVGCYAHAWANADCTANWQIWQYSSCGIASKYGIPSNRVDLNVFNGSSSAFVKLLKGVWTPEVTDMLPINEPTTMNIVSQVAATTNDPVTFSVDVFRPDNSPVVTGTVVFTPASSGMIPGKQDPVRTSSGRWNLSITGLTAGTYLGTIDFTDQSGTEAPVQIPVTFVVTQGIAPTPTPTPSPTPRPKPTPVDTCIGQVRY